MAGCAASETASRHSGGRMNACAVCKGGNCGETGFHAVMAVSFLIGQILPINEKARRVLGWAPASSKDAAMATARSLLELGLQKAG